MVRFAFLAFSNPARPLWLRGYAVTAFVSAAGTAAELVAAGRRRRGVAKGTAGERPGVTAGFRGA
ncbi:hypothetical protein ABT033_03675 [Streptomyces pharetrae]|uniref:hypothetical protein n=1 Tax=Streptomyces pharetrae TaxID=291370 RepID=UPI003344E1F3